MPLQCECVLTCLTLSLHTNHAWSSRWYHTLHRLVHELWKRNCSRLDQSKLIQGAKLAKTWPPKAMKLGWTPNGWVLLSFELFGVSAHTHLFSSKCVYHYNCLNVCIHQVLLVLTIAFHCLCTCPLQGNKKEMHEFFFNIHRLKGFWQDWYWGHCGWW